MWKFVFLALISSIVCHDVYRFNREVINSNSETKKIPVKIVNCPDGSLCDDGSSCCVMADGTYACCPYSSAVCCKDKLHCCPQNTECNLTAGTCDSALKKMVSKMKVKIPAIFIRSITCPDGSQCDGLTCCKKEDGNYTCCQYPSAVCCSDKLHCCPQNTVCNLADGTCDSKLTKTVTKMKLKIPAVPNLAVVCPDGSQCPQGSTCCAADGGIYACCPFPSAVCCSDKLHCCPQNTVCNLAAGTCDSKLTKTVTKMKLKIPAIPNLSIVCPDSSQCAEGSTCCAADGGIYACCPFPSAVCCSDKLHCCPQNTVCNLAAGTCDSKLEKTVTKMKLKIPAIPSLSIVCPDGSQCAEGSTCCAADGGAYACCPLPNAVCCSDNLHCCQQNTVCNLTAGTCDSKLEKRVTKMKLKIPAVPNLSIVCPDGSSTCASGSTCCLLSDGSYGCCPFSNAVCCSDELHCCPSNTVCNFDAGTCDSKLTKTVTKMKLKIPAVPNLSIVCPDSSQCAEGSTCCAVDGGTYACCQYPSAVCCSDKLHCCQQNTVCNLTAGTCDSKLTKTVTKMKLKIPAVLKLSIVCPDGSQCAEGSTCCAADGGTYACCPLPNAVCCSDNLHCCQQNTVCNLTAGTCDSKLEKRVTKMKLKIPAVPNLSIVCPDGSSTCESGSTCCLLSDGSYGCCPFSNAVCCSDKLHCCPSNTVCNLAAGTCDSKSNKAISSNPVNRLICPDEKYQCSDGQTCCKSATGDSYGCCPYSRATCCSDGIHCCPQNSVCNTSKGTCDHPTIAFESKIVPIFFKYVTCPDGSLCRYKNTCCPSANNSYSCCPYSNAVCCSDHSHCCPDNTSCSLNTKTCSKNLSLKFLIENVNP